MQSTKHTRGTRSEIIVAGITASEMCKMEVLTAETWRVHIRPCWVEDQVGNWNS